MQQAAPCAAIWWRGTSTRHNERAADMVKLGVLALGALLTAQAVHAQDAGGNEPLQKAVETRQAVFKVINYNSEQFFLMMKNKAPFDASVVQRAAGHIEMLAPMIPEAFSTDTRKGSAKTQAREGIWTKYY
jgi:cytochrome c556